MYACATVGPLKSLAIPLKRGKLLIYRGFHDFTFCYIYKILFMKNQSDQLCPELCSKPEPTSRVCRQLKFISAHAYPSITGNQ